MRRSIVLVSLFLLIPFISAIQINMDSSLSQGQTLIAQVSGNFVNPLQSQNVLLYNGHVRVSFIPTVQKQGDKFYIYGQVSAGSPGNYSLRLVNIKYYEAGKIQTADVFQNFTLTNQTADFSINPGIIQTSGSFYINAQSLSGSTITVSYYLDNGTSVNSPENQSTGFFGFFSGGSSQTSTTNSAETISIDPGQTKKIHFDATGSGFSELAAVLSSANTSYRVPVFLPSNSTSVSNIPALSIEPSQANISLSTNSSTTRYFYVSNYGITDIDNVSFSISNSLKPYVSVINDSVNLSANSTEKIVLNITSGDNATFAQGQIIAKSTNETAYINLLLNFSKGYVPSQNSSSGSLFPSCAEVGGIICTGGQVCTGDLQNTEDGKCCLATCTAQKTNSNAGKIIGWILLILFVGFIVYFLIRKYKKAKKPMNPIEALKKKKN